MLPVVVHADEVAAEDPLKSENASTGLVFFSR